MFVEQFMAASFVMQRTVSRAPGGLHKAMIIKFLNYSNTDKPLQLARLNKSLIYNSDKYWYSLIAVWKYKGSRIHRNWEEALGL